jgi:hypothetical protein
MIKRLQKRALLMGIAALAVLASRLPFLTPGYGADPDGWLIIQAARSTAQTGQYHTSRFPCYPVPELFYVLINRAGPFACNLVTAALSAAAFLFFTLILRHYNCRDAILGGLALAFTPIVFINSTNTMDYMWAFCFLLGGMYFVLKERPLLAGIMLGLAIGSRITSGAMLLPFCLMWPASEERMPWKSMLIFVVAALAVGAVTYLPVFYMYGLSFLVFYEGAEYPDLGVVWKRAAQGVWGPIGANSLLIAFVAGLVLHKNTSMPKMRGDVRMIISWVAALVAGSLPYWRLPYDAGYLMPIVPFVILLFARVTHRRVFQILCIALMASSFITIYRSWINFNGPIFKDREYRINYDETAEKLIEKTKNYPPKSVVITGAFLPMVLVKTEEAAPAQTPQYVYLLKEADFKRYQADGYTIYYIAGQREINRALCGADPADYGAVQIDLGVPDLK